MNVRILHHGDLWADEANIIAMANLATDDDHHRAARWVPTPIYTVLIEREDGLTMFDAGAHPLANTERWDTAAKQRTPYVYTDDQLLPAKLASLGYKPTDVRNLIISHLHEDHAGCMEMFTDARIYVHGFELSETLKRLALNDLPGGYIERDIRAWLQAGLHITAIEDDEPTRAVAPGLTILNFGAGHTFGMLGLLIERPRKNVLVVSDAVNTARNFGPPVLFPGLAYDTIGYERTVRRIHRLAREYDAEVWFGHDPDQLRTLLKRQEEGAL